MEIVVAIAIITAAGIIVWVRMVTEKNKLFNAVFANVCLTASKHSISNQVDAINDELLDYGFVKKVDYDKDFHLDRFDTLMFVTFSIQLEGSIVIEVCHTYTASTPSCFYYHSTCCSLSIEGTSFEMPGANINRIISLLAILKKCFDKNNTH